MSGQPKTGCSRPELVDRGVLDRLGGRAIDRNGAGLLALGELTLQLDMEQAILERGAGYFDILGELEAELESALGNAAMQELALLLGGGGFGALDDEAVLLGLDHEVALGKAGNRDGDAVGIIADLLDVVGRVGFGFLADEAIETVEDAIETDGRAIEGGKIIGLHGHILRVSNVDLRVSHTLSLIGESAFPGGPVPGDCRRTA